MIVLCGIPLLLMYFLLNTNLLNWNHERIFRTLWIMTIIFAAYIIAITQAFFMTFRYKLYKHILEKSKNDIDDE